MRQHAIPAASLCGLDLGSRTWSSGLPPLSALDAITTGITQKFGNPAFDKLIDAGWEGPSPVGRWTVGPEASLTFLLPPEAIGHELTLKLRGWPLVWTNGKVSSLRLAVNGNVIQTWNPAKDVQELTAIIPKDLTGSATVELSVQIDQPRSPAEMGMSADGRRLGFFVTDLRLDQPSP